MDMDSTTTNEQGFVLPLIIITDEAGRESEGEVVSTFRHLNLNSEIQPKTNNAPEEGENNLAGITGAVANKAQIQQPKDAMIGHTGETQAATASSNEGITTFKSNVSKIPNTIPQIPTNLNTGRLEYNIYDNVGHYKIIDEIGQGSFGDVVKARHLRKRNIVAIKINCFEKPEHRVNMYEVSVLFNLTEDDIDDKIPFVKLLSYFKYNAHGCIVTEYHGMDLWKYQAQNGNKPFPMEILKWIVYQLLLALEFLHSKHIVHCDIKGDNILLDSVHANQIPIGKLTMMQSRIRLADFGSAVDYRDVSWWQTKTDPMVQPIAYRAPEVFLRVGWDRKIDVWSLACIVLEFYNPVCKDLFADDDDYEDITKLQLKIMEVMFGKFPQRFIEEGDASLFDKNGFIMMDEREDLNPFKYGPLKLYQLNKEDDETKSLFDLLSKLFVHDPNQRYTPTLALAHPCFDSTKLKI